MNAKGKTLGVSRKLGGSRALGAFCAIAAFAGFMSSAPAAETNPIAAVVNGSTIRLSEVKEAQDLLPSQLQGAPFDKVYGMLLDSLINSRLAAEQAEKMGLAKTKEYTDRMARIGNQVLERMVLSRYIGGQLSEDKLKKRYDTLVEDAKGRFRIHARHILVKGEDEAKKIIAELKAGGDFAALAKAHSIGPKAKDGGDLGWVTPGSMIPSLEKVTMSLPVGSVSYPAVRTRLGWNIIKVVERRSRKIPPFVIMRGKIAALLSAELGQAYIVKLRKAATIVKKPLNVR